jgi:hypothetical protein
MAEQGKVSIGVLRKPWRLILLIEGNHVRITGQDVQWNL